MNALLDAPFWIFKFFPFFSKTWPNGKFEISVQRSNCLWEHLEPSYLYKKKVQICEAVKLIGLGRRFCNCRESFAMHFPRWNTLLFEFINSLLEVARGRLADRLACLSLRLENTYWIFGWIRKEEICCALLPGLRFCKLQRGFFL